jgi:hypothetical protein
MPAASINCLAIVLRELGWSYTRLIAELRRHAGVALPKTESMVALVSRWVNNHQQPDEFYRDLLSRATGRSRTELFSDEPVGLTALPSGLVVARSGDGLPATGRVPLSLGGAGLVAWLGQQEPELKGGSVERRSFLASLALLGVDLTALAPASPPRAWPPPHAPGGGAYRADRGRATRFAVAGAEAAVARQPQPDDLAAELAAVL